MSPEKLVLMANQIGRFFDAQQDGKAVANIAEHIRKFWEPRMRRQMEAHIDAGGQGLIPDVRAAFERLREEERTIA